MNDIIYAPVLVATFAGLVSSLFITPIGGLLVFMWVLHSLRG